MTKKDWFEEIKAVVRASELANKDEAIAFIDHEIELLSNRSKGSKPTATQRENVAIKEKILEVLRDCGERMTVSELLKDSRLCDYSNQKLSALLRQLKLDGVVEKEVDKKKAYFYLAD